MDSLIHCGRQPRSGSPVQPHIVCIAAWAVQLSGWSSFTSVCHRVTERQYRVFCERQSGWLAKSCEALCRGCGWRFVECHAGCHCVVGARRWATACRAVVIKHDSLLAWCVKCERFCPVLTRLAHECELDSSGVSCVVVNNRWQCDDIVIDSVCIQLDRFGCIRIAHVPDGDHGFQYR